MNIKNIIIYTLLIIITIKAYTVIKQNNLTIQISDNNLTKNLPKQQVADIIDKN